MEIELINFGKKALYKSLRGYTMDIENKDKLEVMLENHRLMSIRMKELKGQENDLRIEIVDMLKEEGYKTIGTHNLNMRGMDVKIVLKVNTKIDNDILPDLIDDLTEEELACIKYEPKLKMKEYNALELDQSDPDGIYLDDAITTSDAMPTLTVTLAET